ncbi:hypothetical protein CDCA_CDCA02G0781 [Cyanidium caldarium]|uniref:CBS domain-containing protein n=1 Tax=Cyanidium caldarium TaxID=2771 RepID=A0AAV9IRD3_CYACA|nr:hypothetical protein CDCA_CDCA02G0781 [Cyanidium caldarium]
MEPPGADDVPASSTAGDGAAGAQTMARHLEVARAAVTRFMKERRVDEVLPMNSRVVVLEVGLSLADAFAALLEQQTAVALLWDASSSQELVGMLSTADVGEILLFLQERLDAEDGAVEDSGGGEAVRRSLSDDQYDQRALALLHAQTLDGWLQFCRRGGTDADASYGSGAGVARKRAGDGALAAPSSLWLRPPAKWSYGRLPRHNSFQMVTCRANGSLYEASVLLRDHHIHHLPLISGVDKTVLSVLDHARILSFLSEQLAAQQVTEVLNQDASAELPADAVAAAGTSATLLELFSVPIEMLRIGTFQDVLTVNENQSLQDALRLMVDGDVHALPVVNEAGALVNVLSRTDALWLIAPELLHTTPAPSPERIEHNAAAPAPNFSLRWRYHLLRDTTVKVRDHPRLTQQRRHRSHRLATCNPHDTLNTVFQHLGYDFRVRQVFVVDEQQHVLGVISLSDILAFFMDRSRVIAAGSGSSAAGVGHRDPSSPPLSSRPSR